MCKLINEFNVFLCILCFATVNPQNYNNNNEKNEFFGTKTPYRFIANNIASKIEYEGCTPIKLWMLVRHGTRNPSAKLIASMLKILPKLRDEIISSNPKATEYLKISDLERFHNWHCAIEELDEKLLAHEGEEEMIALAERMQIRFPHLLPPIYSNTTFNFKYTATQRTQQSAKYFTIGLFGRKTARDVWFPEPSTRDPILRFYKLCEKWRKEIKKNPNTLAEKLLFESSELMNVVAKDVSKRLNLSTTVTNEELHVIYMTCAFETAWSKNIKSPWCIPFTEESFKIKAFSEDLRYYWVDGFGHELTYKQACPAFGNMAQYFMSSESTPKSVVYFTHSGTLLKVIAHLGLYRDDKPLTHKDFEKNDRLWHVSKIDPFGTNLAFVLFRCGADSENSNKIAIFHNEHLIKTPACLHSELCDIDILLDYYKDSLDSCDFTNMCK